MRKKQIVTALLLLGIVFLFFCIAALTMTETIDMTPAEGIGVNYNNYIGGNTIDYRDGRFAKNTKALFMPVLTITDEKGNTQRMFNIGKQFQIMGSDIVYLKGGDLFRRTDKKTRIASDVTSFVAFEEEILYLCVSDRYDDVLFRHDNKTGQTSEVQRNVLSFCADNDRCVVLGLDGQITVCSGKTSQQTVKIEIPSMPFEFMMHNDSMVFEMGNRICLIDIYSGESTEVRLTDRTHVNDRLVLICDDDRIFASFQATKTDGSVVSDVTDDANGTWIIDADALRAKKILDRTFEELYLFGGELFGVDGDEVYRILAERQETVRITK